MARSSHKWYNQKSKRTGRKTAKRIKANCEVLKSLSK